MAFQSLPVELIRLILPYCQPADLSSLLRTCRSLMVLAQPLLYEDIDLGVNELRIGKPPLQLLLKTLLHQPELGYIVKRLYIRGRLTDSKLDATDVKALARRGTSISNVKYASWLTFLSWSTHATGNCQASTMLLLSYCHNLESLALENDLCYTLPEIGNLKVKHVNEITSPIHILSSLKCLKSIRYLRNNAREQSWRSLRWTSPLVAGLFSLPQIISLTLSVCEDGNYRHNSQVETYLSSVTHLELQDSNISEPSVGALLNRAPNLTSLRVGLTRDANPLPPYRASNAGTFLDCARLGACLAEEKLEGSSSVAHAPRIILLQHLAISVKFFSTAPLDISDGPLREIGPSLDGNGDRTLNWGIKDSIGSLRDYSALKTLEIPLPVLLGWYFNRARPLAELLPSSLEELCFRADMSHWDLFKWDVSAVKDLIETYAISGNRGRLRVIKYTLLVKDHEKHGDLLNSMRRVCSGAGIRFEVLRLDKPEEDY